MALLPISAITKNTMFLKNNSWEEIFRRQEELFKNNTYLLSLKVCSTAFIVWKTGQNFLQQMFRAWVHLLAKFTLLVEELLNTSNYWKLCNQVELTREMTFFLPSSPPPTPLLPHINHCYIFFQNVALLHFLHVVNSYHLHFQFSPYFRKLCITGAQYLGSGLMTQYLILILFAVWLLVILVTPFWLQFLLRKIDNKPCNSFLWALKSLNEKIVV